MTTIYVAMSVYGPDADITPITGVGTSPELARAALNQSVRAIYSGDAVLDEEIDELVSEWIESPVQSHELPLESYRYALRNSLLSGDLDTKEKVSADRFETWKDQVLDFIANLEDECVIEEPEA